MSKQNIDGIAWTDHTANVAGGCTKISSGCNFCYAEKMAKINPATHGTWGPNGARVAGSRGLITVHPGFQCCERLGKNHIPAPALARRKVEACGLRLPTH